MATSSTLLHFPFLPRKALPHPRSTCSLKRTGKESNLDMNGLKFRTGRGFSESSDDDPRDESREHGNRGNMYSRRARDGRRESEIIHDDDSSKDKPREESSRSGEDGKHANGDGRRKSERIHGGGKDRKREERSRSSDEEDDKRSYMDKRHERERIHDGDDNGRERERIRNGDDDSKTRQRATPEENSESSDKLEDRRAMG
ncbi:pre-mRNA-splicing factor CWC25-like [Hibiscus syriacus]|uniref:pre-mRNA-splicing factor CWC25-like n=1 Tax=Hibiscus syriacus TaxID=106335 RepID=UPI001920B4BF|nr:pre-mRNA-splicing factor CWC25-like [Hibiscus syriacus]